MGKNVMTLRQFEPSDFAIMERWAHDHGQVAPLWEELEGQEGYMVDDEEGPIAAAFLYIAGPLGILEAMTSRPKINLKTAREATGLLEQWICNRAKTKGLKRLITFVSSRGMVRETLRAGYRQAGSPMAQMVKTLN